jgi:hypothetical protein
VAELALIAGVSMPEIPRETLQLTDSETAQLFYTKRAQEQEEWELTCSALSVNRKYNGSLNTQSASLGRKSV